ncbi:MAG: aldo/keto reductase [Gorillibacterium sp.]|nr:aldo/keto reductase [Gorillibacterium sp.]
MKTMSLERRGITTSRLALGCMGLGGSWNNDPLTAEDHKRTEAAVEAALSIGITMFDHADVYCMTKSEQVFGELLATQPGLREQLVIQSKCGIRFADEHNPKRFDFSKEHILASVDGILERLHTDYLDILLLHRPDPLMEPDEVAEAFNQLVKSGKVRHFGVSNMSAGQMNFLSSAVVQPLVVNQLELSLAHLDFLDQGVHVNQKAGLATNFADDTLEYCQIKKVQVQAWSPLAKGIFSGRSVEGKSEAVQNTAKLVSKLAKAKETTPEAIVLGWLMRHPAKIQPIIGASNPERIRACEDAVKIADQMSREDWYELYTSARGNDLP